MIEVGVHTRRNRPRAERCFRKLLKGHRRVPFRWVTDKLRSKAEMAGTSNTR